jgi:hypothetical protein
VSDSRRLREKYTLARCCGPTPPDLIGGYFSHNDLVKVHRSDCPNLARSEAERRLSLEWNSILEPEQPQSDIDPGLLDPLDFEILRHHREYDIDYSLMVAKVLKIDRQEAFGRHQKLRNLGLLERVDALMVRYRKNTVEHKWIKHRNHTYYRLTKKGERCLGLHAPGETPPPQTEA